MLKETRKINIRLLVGSTIAYRIFVVFEQYAVVLVLGHLTEIEALQRHSVSLGISILWNIINTITYYVWHYLLLTRFRFRRNNRKEKA